jgi:hypothetical protein
MLYSTIQSGRSSWRSGPAESFHPILFDPLIAGDPYATGAAAVRAALAKTCGHTQCDTRDGIALDLP